MTIHLCFYEAITMIMSTNTYNYYLMYGRNNAVIKNSIPDISAVFLRVDSIDFLLQYSFDQLDQPIHNPSHPFGLIKSTEITKTIPTTIRATINNVFIEDIFVCK